MKCPTYPVSLALTLLALLGAVGPALAQPPPQEMVAFSATVEGPLPNIFVIPVTPPIGDGRLTARGEATLLGEVTFIERHTLHYGVDGKPVSVSDGIGVLAGMNGDALFITRSGLARATMSGMEGEFGYTVIGGKGRFTGATGSGVMRAEGNRMRNELICIFDGTISAPKP